MNSQSQNELADHLLSQGRFAEAVPHLERLLEADPSNLQGAVNLASAFQQTGEHEKAVEIFEQVLAWEDLVDSDRAALSERTGYCLLALGQVDRALQTFENAISADDKSFRAYVGLGLCMAQMKKAQDAEYYFQRAISIEPRCADAHNNLGVLAWSDMRLDDAFANFKRALEIDPLHKDALPNYLSLAFTLEMYDEAESLLKLYLKAAPDNPELAYQLAYCHAKQGRKEEARAMLEKLLANDPNREEAQDLLVECERE